MTKRLLIANGAYYLQGANGWGEQSCATPFATELLRNAEITRLRKAGFDDVSRVNVETDTVLEAENARFKSEIKRLYEAASLGTLERENARLREAVEEERVNAVAVVTSLEETIAEQMQAIEALGKFACSYCLTGDHATPEHEQRSDAMARTGENT